MAWTRDKLEAFFARRRKKRKHDVEQATAAPGEHRNVVVPKAMRRG